MVRPLEPVERSNAGARAATPRWASSSPSTTRARAAPDSTASWPSGPTSSRPTACPSRTSTTTPAGRTALMSGLLSFAREQGATVAAEGVETTAKLETLGSLGVPLAQGYHLGRPEPLPDLSDQRSATRFTVAPSET